MKQKSKITEYLPSLQRDITLIMITPNINKKPLSRNFKKTHTTPPHNKTNKNNSIIKNTQTTQTKYNS